MQLCHANFLRSGIELPLLSMAYGHKRLIGTVLQMGPYKLRTRFKAGTFMARYRSLKCRTFTGISETNYFLNNKIYPFIIAGFFFQQNIIILISYFQVQILFS